jgi:hypothetical protein
MQAWQAGIAGRQFKHGLQILVIALHVLHLDIAGTTGRHCSHALLVLQAGIAGMEGRHLFQAWQEFQEGIAGIAFISIWNCRHGSHFRQVLSA